MSYMPRSRNVLFTFLALSLLALAPVRLAAQESSSTNGELSDETVGDSGSNGDPEVVILQDTDTSGNDDTAEGNDDPIDSEPDVSPPDFDPSNVQGMRFSALLNRFQKESSREEEMEDIEKDIQLL